jgi:hypothetical protein
VFGKVDAFLRGSVAAGGEYVLNAVGKVDGVPAGDTPFAGGQGEQCLDEPFLVSAKGECVLPRSSEHRSRYWRTGSPDRPS